MARRPTPESPYSKLVRESGLNSADTHGWSGRGNHVEFKRREDVPLRMDEVLGQGAYAVVQKVVCNDERPLAQKIIQDYKKTGLDTIMSEVKHIQCLRHRHLIQFVGTYVIGHKLHILMFPVGQWNLRSFMKEFDDPKTNRKAFSQFYSLRRFFKCLAHAVAYLHNEIDPRIKHLDIKPENAIVIQHAAHGLTVLLTDFGVSRSFPPKTTSQDYNTLYTTPMYAAPEVVKRGGFGRPADMFSLGCVYSEMASILGDKTLLQYEEHRQFRRENGTDSLAFEGNLGACRSWLQRLRTNVPFQQLSNQDSVWWTRLLSLIEKMLSERASDRPNSTEVLDDISPEPCCDVVLEEFKTSKPKEEVDENPEAANPGVGPRPTSPTIQEPLLQNATVALQSISLSPWTQPSTPFTENESRDAVAATELDWSGKGAHVGYGTAEQVPLKELEVIALGSSLVTKVQSTRRGPYIFAKKTLQRSSHRLGLEMLLQEVKVLQNLRNPHIVRLVGTIDEERFFSLLSYPAAKWNLRTFMESISDIHAKDPEKQSRKSALQNFDKCLMQGLNYLHSQKVRHKDIKPSNILVHQLRNDYYLVYLAGK